MAEPNPPARPGPRYRVICYELTGGHQTLIMDSTDHGFIAATAAIADGVMQAELVHAGPQQLQAHLALMIANDQQLLGDHPTADRRPR